MGLSRKAVGLIHFTAPPVVGGVESILGHHARLLDEAGYGVRIIAGRGGEHLAHVQFTNLPLADSSHPDVLAIKKTLDTGRIPKEFERVVRQIRLELAPSVRELDILIAHNVCSLHKNLALTAALREICAQSDAPRLIIWHHDLAWTSSRYESELHEGWPWSLLCEDWPEVQPTHVVVSELRRRELAKLLHILPDSIQVVPSGLRLDRFYKLEPQTLELIQRSQYQQADPRLFSPVRITRRKNIELAVRTVAAMRRTKPEIGLIVTGPPGPHNPENHIYFDELRQLRKELGVERQVCFLAEIVQEYLPEAVVADLYRVADALLLPSREEGFGIPILEAGLVRLPIFCADIPPLREIAAPHAVFFDPEIDPYELAGLILSQLARNDSYQLRRRIRQHFTWSRIFAERIIPLLEKL
jgi:glycosyltransferase involved in cell wall biosynthesis